MLCMVETDTWVRPARCRKLKLWHNFSASRFSGGGNDAMIPLFLSDASVERVCAGLLEGRRQNELYVYIPDPCTINQLTRFQHKQCVICLLRMRWYSMCCCRSGRRGMQCNTRCRRSLCSMFLAWNRISGNRHLQWVALYTWQKRIILL